MTSKLRKIRVWENVDFSLFHNEIAPLNQPAILKSLVKNWPMVKHGSESTKATIEYLKTFDAQSAAYTVVGNPEINGRFFYNHDLSGINFQRTQASFVSVIEQILALENHPAPHAIAIQAAAVRDILPGFETVNKLTLLDQSIAPTMWLGNKAIVAPHYDAHDNIACVVAGKRRFTLFPPEQIANLYVGPTLNAPGGVPISLVDIREPDLERFPNYQTALNNGQQATLEPGDAIFIPSLWWHAVESLHALNVLVNYWWGGIPNGELSPSESLMHSMLTIAKLEPSKRESWRHFFDYFVFQTDTDPAAHLPSDINDLVTTLTDAQKKAVYALLRSHL